MNGCDGWNWYVYVYVRVWLAGAVGDRCTCTAKNHLVNTKKETVRVNSTGGTVASAGRLWKMNECNGIGDVDGCSMCPMIDTCTLVKWKRHGTKVQSSSAGRL